MRPDICPREKLRQTLLWLIGRIFLSLDTTRILLQHLHGGGFPCQIQSYRQKSLAQFATLSFAKTGDFSKEIFCFFVYGLKMLLCTFIEMI